MTGLKGKQEGHQLSLRKFAEFLKDFYGNKPFQPWEGSFIRL